MPPVGGHGPRKSRDLSCTRHLKRSAANVKKVVAHFDKVAFRSSTKPNKAQLAVLRDNAQSVVVRTGHPIRGSDKRFTITIVVPNRQALDLVKECGWTPNYFEAAIDIIVSEWAEASALHDFLDGSFVQSWHGKQELLRFSPLGADDPCATTYSGQRRANLRFTWYCRLSKITNEPCLHLESRHRGIAACRRAGVYTAADLIHFDHRAHWQRYLACYRIDFTQLGRSHENRREGTRRQKPDISRSGYSVDAGKGSLLFRARSAHERQPMRSVQRFIDQYGRGTFLHRLDVSALLPSIDYVEQCLKLDKQFVSIKENTSKTPPKRTHLRPHPRCRRNQQP
jgi:hypothetical protein